MKIAIFTDTFCDANGVSRFLQDMAKESASAGCALNIVTSTVKMRCEPRANIHNLHPLVRIRMPFFRELDLVFPPVGRMYSTMKRLDPDIVHISTPGPVGLTALILARWLSKPVSGTYHTDFPSYLRKNTKSAWVERVTRWFMRRFYKNFIKIFVRSQEYLSVLENDIGISADRLEVLKPGINTETFDRRYRDTKHWKTYGLRSGSKKVLYVGRLSREKNFLFLLDVWERFYETYIATGIIDADLVVIGEGKLMKRAMKYQTKRVALLGYKGKEDLSRAYASSDLFVFPSVTETLGQVVMEAQASALPVIVSDKGGQVATVDERGGSVLDVASADNWCEEIARYLNDETFRSEASEVCYERMRHFSISRSFEAFWESHLSLGIR